MRVLIRRRYDQIGRRNSRSTDTSVCRSPTDTVRELGQQGKIAIPTGKNLASIQQAAITATRARIGVLLGGHLGVLRKLLLLLLVLLAKEQIAPARLLEHHLWIRWQLLLFGELMVHYLVVIVVEVEPSVEDVVYNCSTQTTGNHEAYRGRG